MKASQYERYLRASILSIPRTTTISCPFRALTRDAMRVVIEGVMREELKQFLGAA